MRGKPSAADLEQLATFAKFLAEVGAHRQLQRAARRRLPFQTVEVPNEWWNPTAPATPTGPKDGETM